MHPSMNMFFLVLISLCLFNESLAGTVVSSSEATEPSANSPLIEALQSGNYIIYMRHGLTERKIKSENSSQVDLTRCETQRNLTEEGKQQVKNIGLAIKSLNIPIGKVSSSPYCRTKDTAKAVFGDYDVDEKLRFSMAMNQVESEMLGTYLVNAMLTSTNTEGNTVFVGHTANLKDGLGVWPKPEGAMVIFQKEGSNIVYKGMIKPTDWLQL